ncbi:uncharacterized protein LOC110409456 isoform X2 [Herrania umbratica]|uniref:Uncharacterized protein LOC110409456 isoform X2 n=1 Tax=Herrania umbratica TaxID=108875 RepID=A0A6J0ZHX4_9ROSI|nr:uncharacterized protein LOC110409456 isoform X2 [Herrania umbratica]
MPGDNKPTTIKLFCPSVSKLVPFVVWDGQKLDLGSIARAFGLDPSTVKLNGHFISRGVDLVSPSVTWRSLLSFFSSKGLSTGTDDKSALIVDGKLCKVGTKRCHEGASRPVSEWNGLGFKRKSFMGDVSLLNKLKINETSSDFQASGNNGSSTILSTPFKCCYLSGSMKRMREDEVVVAASCKRVSYGCHST